MIKDPGGSFLLPVLFMLGSILLIDSRAESQVNLTCTEIDNLKASTQAVSRMVQAPARYAVSSGPWAAPRAHAWSPAGLTPAEMEEQKAMDARFLAIQAGFSDPKGAALEGEAKAISELLDQVRRRYPELSFIRPRVTALTCGVKPKPFRHEERRWYSPLLRETPVRDKQTECLKAVAVEAGWDQDPNHLFGGYYFLLGIRDARKIMALFKGCPNVLGVSCGFGGSWAAPQDYVDMRRTQHAQYALSYHHCTYCGGGVNRWRAQTLKVQYDLKRGSFSFGPLVEEP